MGSAGPGWMLLYFSPLMSWAELSGDWAVFSYR